MNSVVLTEKNKNINIGSCIADSKIGTIIKSRIYHDFNGEKNNREKQIIL